MKKLIVILMAIALSLVLLSGCSSKKTPKDEKDIIADIKTDDSYYTDFNLQVSESKIIDRLTSTERQTDQVYIEVTSKNNDFIYTTQYEVDYLLYDDGWKLYDVRRLDYDVTPTTTISQAQADKDAKEAFGNVSFISYSENDEKTIYKYLASNPEGYINIEREVSLFYEFTPYKGWTYTEYTSPNTSSVKWDIVGEWEYNDGTNYIWIKVIDIDDSTITVEYDMTYENFSIWHDETGTFASNGPIRLNYDWYQKNNYLNDNPFSIFTEHIPETGQYYGSGIWIYNNLGVTWLGEPLTKIK